MVYEENERRFSQVERVLLTFCLLFVFSMKIISEFDVLDADCHAFAF
jgi:hypothetical protein